MAAFSKILIANRGEIAVRVIRACTEMEIATVAVFSEADRTALHVRLADEAYPIGPAPSRESYLVQENILAAAKAANADAIHPGYGFLSENAEFAERVAKAGLTFIGPSPAAMRLMGDKTAARQCMTAAGVPTVPGSDKELSENKIAAIAEQLGYPVLLKAAAGGGGKGMRIVHEKSEITSSFRAAQSEAESAFGDGRIYIEKYIEAPRHIEFQILADNHGNVIHLGERECSIQRRHQKIIEEAPSCVLDEMLRKAMGETAIKAATACNYSSAGTIEFIFDQNRQFYFLEMNTRLQVEHPVTEMVFGLDLVKEQIRIAAGAPLSFNQNDVSLRGHAIECRIYAEDPANNFLPSTGKISHLVPPAGPGVRDDGGYFSGSEVSIYYDPLLAKLVVWGQNREEAIARMKRALGEYRVIGIETSIPFCQMVMNHDKFVSGDFDTHFIEKEFLTTDNGSPDLSLQGDSLAEETARIAAALYHHELQRQPTISTNSKQDGKSISPWKLAGRKR